MKRIIMLFLFFIVYSCSNSIYLSKLNNNDQEYIKEKLNNDLNCISYEWNGIKDTKVNITIEITPKGRVSTINVNNDLNSTQIIKTIANYYNDTTHYFVIKIDKRIIYSTNYNYTSVNRTPCQKYYKDGNL